MLSKEILKQIKRVELKAGHTVTNALAGEYSSVFKGVGMEFEKVREYLPGDDVRSFDWNVMARTNTPHIKVFREEREMTILLLVDVSPSTLFGKAESFKNETATELATIIAYLATKNNDRVGLVLFSDHIERFIPPNKGKSHIWRLVRELITHNGTGNGTDIKAALDFVMRVYKRRSQLFLISDFIATGYETALQLAARRHSVVCVSTVDSSEREVPNIGVLGLKDPESGQIIDIDTSDPQTRKAWRHYLAADQRKREQFFSRNKIESFAVQTTDSVVQQLIKFFRHREKALNR